MSDTLVVFGTTYNNVAGFKATDSSDNTKTYIRPTGTKQITANGTGIDVAEYAAVDVNVSGGGGSDLIDFIEGNNSGSFTNSGITTIRAEAFRKYNSITSVSFPNVTSIGLEAFRDNTGVTSVLFPNVTSIGGTAFYGCTALQSAFFPLATSFPAYGFYGCTSLVSAVGPVCGEISDAAFQGCSNLEAADGNFGPIRGSAFSGCTKLGLLVLRNTSLCRLFNISAFTNTKFASGKAGGDIYIPKSLYDHLGDGTGNDYQSASNWSTLHGYGTVTWHAIEGSYYETHYADGTAIS